MTGVDAQYRRIPDALGAAGVSQDFGETDLGGFTAPYQQAFSLTASSSEKNSFLAAYAGPAGWQSIRRGNRAPMPQRTSR